MSSPSARRLHTIAGAIVLAAFVVEHVATNASVLWGADAYDRVVGSIQRWKLLALFEVVFILLPLAYHAIYGLRLLARPSADAEVERFGDRRLWVLQRVSATVVFLFVAVHLWELRVQRLFFGLDPAALHTVLTAHLSWTYAGVPWLALFYLLGVAATSFHLANGLFAASALKGWATRRMRVLTSIVGGAVFVAGALTVLGFATGTQFSSDPSGANAPPCGSVVAPK
ncbi:MAG: hypothetical protein KIT84_02660 [Labilithrix sp.]|nr:hypothetical protein [Labilithrix sp.]MCW5809882.1 hypothetical protein [Labilithrix sp.]